MTPFINAQSLSLVIWNSLTFVILSKYLVDSNALSPICRLSYDYLSYTFRKTSKPPEKSVGKQWIIPARCYRNALSWDRGLCGGRSIFISAQGPSVCSRSLCRRSAWNPETETLTPANHSLLWLSETRLFKGTSARMRFITRNTNCPLAPIVQ